MNLVYYPQLPPLPDIPLDVDLGSYHQSGITDSDKDLKTVSNSTWATRYMLNHEIMDWVKTNIALDFDSMGLNYHNVSPDSNIPHVDRTRNWVLMWILDTGGDNVLTIFWQEKGFDLVRNAGCYPKKNHDLIEVERHLLKPNQWILLNGNVIHSVENICFTRKSIQLGFWNNSSFIAKHTT